MGRKPTPSWLKVVDGNPGKRPLNEPTIIKRSKAADVIPRLKTNAPKDVAIIWRRIMKNAPAGLLTGIDSNLLYRYCRATALYEEAEEKLYAPQASRLMKTQSGHVQQSVWLSILNRQTLIISKLEAELGFTPVSRVRLGVEVAPVGTEEGSDYIE